MIISTGVLQSGGDVLLENITFYISQIKANREHLGEWSGYFTIPPNGRDAAWKLFHDDQNPSVIVLENGLKGQIRIVDYGDLSVGANIRFVGTGPLK